MSTILPRRLTTLALCAVLGLSGLSHGSILVRDPDGSGDAAARVPELSATDVLTARGTFSLVNFEDYQQRKQALHQALETMGFQAGWNGSFGDGTVSTWYSPTLNTTMVCLETVTNAGLSHRAYAMAGHVGRKAYFLW